jgi:hypothetical protein
MAEVTKFITLKPDADCGQNKDYPITYPQLDTFELWKMTDGVLKEFKDGDVNIGNDKIIIKANTAIKEDLIVRSYVGAYKKKVRAIDIPLKVHLCGYQKLTLASEDTLELRYNIDAGEDAESKVYTDQKVSEMFKNSFPACEILSYRTVGDTSGNA